jgi:hypothetical protein
MEAMQQEQINLQKQQLRKMSDNDPDNIGEAVVKAGAAVVGVVAATKIGKEIIKNLKDL